MTEIIGWLIASGYVATGLFFARSTLRRWQADPKSTLDLNDRFERGMAALSAFALGLIWPITLAFFVLRDWLWKPADADRARWDQMVTDRDNWRHTARNAASEEERATATTIADTLDDLLRRGGKQ